ncbi:hypothetical protein MSAN_02491300 [Mycena sanguinolenta]|uniref:Protein kinase domain-containing protein n=1 Tax=Mycena sanguinolenta TaxID=230812 RepID=A0A8H6U228_9AGAR|nr:hypothetical protein MSAN_02491300 [Mycena sanguinolenta]
MDSQSESEADFIVVSTSDYPEALPPSAVVFPQANRLTRNAKLSAKSFGFLPSFLGVGMQAVDRLVTNYHYYISGGQFPFRTIRLGDGAEEKWRQDRAAYESIRHPNILQLYGLVNTKKLCAMVFHHELIPYGQFLRRFEHSPILTIYILGYCKTEWEEAAVYLSSIFPTEARLFSQLPEPRLLGTILQESILRLGEHLIG